MGTVFAVPRNSWWAQALQNRLIAFVLAMIVVVPLVASPADRTMTGIAAFTFEGLAVLLLVTLLWRTRWELNRERVLTFLRTGANLPVLLLLALAMVSCAFSPHKGFSVQETLKLGAGVVVYFVVAYHFRQSKHLSMLVDTLLFLALAVSIIGMGQYALDPQARGTTFFGNQQPLGSLLMILLPIVAVIAITEKAIKRQLVAQIATVLTAGCLLLAHTRSAWIGAAAGLLTLGLLAMLSAARQSKLKGNLTTQKHKLVLPLLLVLVTAGFFFLVGTQNSGIVERAVPLGNASGVPSWQYRQQQWHGTVEMIKAKPWTGWGIGLYPMYQEKYTGLGTEISGCGIRVSLAEQAHNFYLQTAADLGLPGLLLMLGVLASFLIAGLNRVDKMDPGIRHSLLMGSMAATVAFAVDAVSSPSWQFGQVSMFLWLMLGVGVSCLRPRSKADEVEEPVVAVSPRVAKPFSFAVAGLVLMALLPTYGFAGTACEYNQRCKNQCETQYNSCLKQADQKLIACRNCRQACRNQAERACAGKTGAAFDRCVANKRAACEQLNGCRNGFSSCRAFFDAEVAQCGRRRTRCRNECDAEIQCPIQQI